MSRCPECGALQPEGRSCQDDFYQMLFWEAGDLPLGEVHHLMVLCYHLQHPSLYSPEGLKHGLGLLVDFVARGLSPQEVRRRSAPQVASGRRNFKVTGSPAGRGGYPQPVAWTMTARDVVAAGAGSYREQVRAWSQSILEVIPPEWIKTS